MDCHGQKEWTIQGKEFSEVTDFAKKLVCLHHNADSLNAYTCIIRCYDENGNHIDSKKYKFFWAIVMEEVK